MNKRAVCIALVAALAVALIAAVVVGMHIVPAVNPVLRISELMHPVMQAKNQTMHISVSARVDEQSISTEGELYMVTEEESSYLAFEQTGMTLYVADNLLLLENGKAFRLGKEMHDQAVSWQNLLPHIGALYDALTITTEETEDAVTYAITVTGEQMDALLAAASLGASLPVESVEKLDLLLTEKNGKLEQIRFSGNGEANGAAVELDVTISGFRVLASGDYPIPDAVRKTVQTVDHDGLFSLTEDLYRLVRALAPMTDMDSIDGVLALDVDCGLIQLETELRLSDLPTTASGQTDPEQLKALPEMIGLLCMQGDIRCTPEDGAYVYSLELDEEAMHQLSRMILPALAQYGENLTAGVVTIRLDGQSIESMEVAITGNIPALITQIPVSVRAAFLFE